MELLKLKREVKMKFTLLLTLILVTSCANVKAINNDSKNIQEEKQDLLIINRTVDVEVRPGKITFVEFDINLPDGKWELTCKDKKVPFIVLKNKAKLFLAETYFSKMKPYRCQYEDDSDLNDIEVHDV